MIIEVHHLDHRGGGSTHVANVTVSDGTAHHVALEFAYRWTNNIEGSWSRRDLPEAENPDANPEYVEVVAPLPTHNGKPIGLRSSMMRDQFVVEGLTYEVATFGFDLVAVNGEVLSQKKGL
jgi:hypothetical protein